MRILVFPTVVCILHVCFGQASVCPLQPYNLTRFGPSCEYLCHCRGQQCDRNTGACLEGTECDVGWMGSGCQYANIVYNAEIQTNYVGDVQRIVDGSKYTCSYLTSQNRVTSLTIDFKREFKIKEVHVLFSHEAPPFNVSVISTSATSLCDSVMNTSQRTEFIVKCGISLYGQRINIIFDRSDAGVALCELQSPAGRNLAYGKPAEQSSIFESWYAGQAVDGVTSSSIPWVTCTHTSEQNDPWWLLDLQGPFMIQWFRIYNRMPDINDPFLNKRLMNFRILLSQDNKTFTEYYQDQNINPLIVINASHNFDVMARYVKIDLQGSNRTLTLCEVQVFGDCSDGRYGNCKETCDNCLGKICDKLTGYCSGCQPGYFGNYCNKSCARCEGGYCHRDSGVCLSCPPGALGDVCMFDCPDFFYGYNCIARCGNCSNGDMCNKTTGNCIQGCQKGWKGEKCLEECFDHFYGNCSTPCGHCAEGRPCNKVNGLCDEGGCEDGWHTDKCDTLIQQTVGAVNNTALVAGTVSAVVGILILVAVILALVKARRKRNTSGNNTNDGRRVETSNQDANSMVGDTGKTTNKTVNANPDISRIYHEIDETAPQGSVAIYNTNVSFEGKEPGIARVHDYEEFQLRRVTDESSYSGIDDLDN